MAGRDICARAARKAGSKVRVRTPTILAMVNWRKVMGSLQLASCREERKARLAAG